MTSKLESQKNLEIQVFDVNLVNLMQIFCQIIAKTMSLIILKAFFNLNIEGQDYALSELILSKKNKKGLIFAMNHISHIDPPLFTVALNIFKKITYPTFFVSASKDVYNYGIFDYRTYFYGGKIFKALCAYPVYYGLRNYKLSLQNHIKLLTDGKHVLYFPEGKVNYNPELKLTAKPGVAFLSSYTKTNIIPVHIIGDTKFSFLSLLKIKKYKKKITIKFKKIIYYNELDELYNNDYKSAAQYIYDKILC